MFACLRLRYKERPPVLVADESERTWCDVYIPCFQGIYSNETSERVCVRERALLEEQKKHKVVDGGQYK